MGLFDYFSGAPGQTAAKNNVAAINAGLQQGGNALLTSYGAGQNFLLGDGKGADGALQYATGGYDRARGDVGDAYNSTQGYLGQATNAYQPLVSAGQGALGSYYDAIGANGADGSARAASAFQASPGYDYAMDQALGAVQRTAAARGVNGGNLTADILKTATGLASQGYQQYLDNLKGGVGTYATGVQGLANGLTTQGGASQSYGNALSALGTGQGNAQANIFGQAASGQQSLGNQFNGLINNSTGALVNNNNALAASQTAASGNALGAIVGLGKSALDFNPFKGL